MTAEQHWAAVGTLAAMIAAALTLLAIVDLMRWELPVMGWCIAYTARSIAYSKARP